MTVSGVHEVVKPEVLASTAVGLLDREVIIPNTFTKKGVEEFRGARDDTINMKVPGVLPFRTYGWRNDRSTELQGDEYTERKIALSFGGDAYSMVFLTDEQKDFDLIEWSELLEMQARAVGRGLENGAVQELNNAPYQVTVPVHEAHIGRGLTEARRVQNRFNVPALGRIAVVGTDFDAAMQNDPTLNFAQYVGDANANAAVRDAALGKHKGYTFIVSTEIDPKTAYLYTPDAFAFLNAAPSIPDSVPFGASASFNGISLRWIRDYESRRTQDRSIVNTYYGYQAVKDVLRGIDESTGFEFVSEGEHFVRAIKLTLQEDGLLPEETSGYAYPAKGSELANITGIDRAGAVAYGKAVNARLNGGAAGGDETGA